MFCIFIDELEMKLYVNINAKHDQILEILLN